MKEVDCLKSTKSLITSIIWKVSERSVVQIINLITQIILARIISPELFGSLSLIVVFYNLAEIFVQKGFSSSLIRKKVVTKEDIDTSFWVCVVAAVIAFCAMFFFAPYVADLYQKRIIIWPLRLLACNLLLSPMYCVCNSLLIRQMKFKIVFFRGLLASIISGLTGIIMALNDFGLWALVFQMVVNQFILTIVMLIEFKFKIGFCISKKAFNDVFSFGRNVLLTEFLLTGIESLRGALIGVKYSTTDLAYYERGQIYPATLMRAINDTLFSTLLPFFTKFQSNKEELKKNYIVVMKMTILIVFPIFFGLAAISKELITLLLTEKWIFAVNYMIVFCIYQAIFPYQIVSKALLYAMGDSRRVLSIEIVKSAISVILMLISIQINPLFVAISLVVVRIAGNSMYIYMCERKIGLLKIISSSWKILVCSIFMFLVVRLFNVPKIPLFILLLLKILVGAATYNLLLFIFEKNTVITIFKMVYGKKEKR